FLAAVAHIPEGSAVALRLFGVAVDRSLAILDRFLDDLLSLSDLVGGVLRPIECVLHPVRRVDETLRLIGGFLRLVRHSREAIGVRTLRLNRALDRLAD